MPRGREPLGTWWLRSPPAPGGGSRATGHMAVLEPCRAMVLVPRSCVDARAFLPRGRAWSHKAHGDSGAFSCRVTGSVPQGTWQHRSPLLASGTLYDMGHVVTSEPSSGGWRALCLGARGGARASWHREWIWSRGADLSSLVHRGTQSAGTPMIAIFKKYDDTSFEIC
jgi:hypothetical protein